MDIKGNKCLESRTSPGALVFGPPDEDSRTDKYHLCTPCWTQLWINYFA